MIVVIGILAAISIVAYSGIQSRAKDTVTKSDIKNMHTVIEKYAAINGVYPSTGSMNTVRTDANCTGGSKQIDWIPDVPEKLPQSNSNIGKGRGGLAGCYMYSSDGLTYILSAWNMSQSGPQNSTLHRRVGFREMFFMYANQYLCNHTSIGGGNSPYVATSDYYKYSFTISNITSCNETSPAGA